MSNKQFAWAFPIALIALGLFNLYLQKDADTKALAFMAGMQVGAGIAMCIGNVLIAQIRGRRS